MNITSNKFQSIPTVAAAFIVIFCAGCAGGGSPLAPQTTSVNNGANPLAATGPSITLSASPTTVVAGQLTTLTWNTSNATSISFSPSLPEAEDRQLTLPTGSATFPLSSTVTYVATVTDSSGHQASSTVTIAVASVQFNFSVEPDTIQPGGSATLSWTTQGISSLTIDQGIGNVSALLPNGSFKVAPGVTTPYTATATDQSGAKLTQQVVVSVAVPPPPVPDHPIKHIIVMLQENRTFDNYFGVLGAYRASKVPGASPTASTIGPSSTTNPWRRVTPSSV